MSRFYANITLAGPSHGDLVAFLNETRRTAYVSPTGKGNTVLFHEDMGGQEELAASVSAPFQCPALLVVGYGNTILLYQLYVNGDAADAYVSQPHDEVESV